MDICGAGVHRRGWQEVQERWSSGCNPLQSRAPPGLQAEALSQVHILAPRCGPDFSVSDRGLICSLPAAMPAVKENAM